MLWNCGANECKRSGRFEGAFQIRADVIRGCDDENLKCLVFRMQTPTCLKICSFIIERERKYGPLNMCMPANTI